MYYLWKYIIYNYWSNLKRKKKLIKKYVEKKKIRLTYIKKEDYIYKKILRIENRHKNLRKESTDNNILSNCH
jgi:hypothetical protein